MEMTSARMLSLHKQLLRAHDVLCTVLRAGVEGGEAKTSMGQFLTSQALGKGRYGSEFLAADNMIHSS